MAVVGTHRGYTFISIVPGSKKNVNFCCGELKTNFVVASFESHFVRIFKTILLGKMATCFFLMEAGITGQNTAS